MERLTKKIDGGTVFPEGLVGVTLTPDNPIMCKMLLRLATYEDTGLTPDEFHAYWVFLEDLIGEQKVGEALDNFRQLVKADKEGRMVVLPCKVGQRVFALLDTNKHISECEVKQIGMGNKIGFIGLEPIGARGREYGVALNGFGKTVFLTREDAEKALEAMK